MATESEVNKNETVTCILQVVQLISLKLLKSATHETLNTDLQYWNFTGSFNYVLYSTGWFLYSYNDLFNIHVLTIIKYYKDRQRKQESSLKHLLGLG